ncbi:MAG TPA: beta-aspartyl-peptidase [Candidatus Lachnoclostridium avicola]|nr:beta-aspartyl-peptidase [Candidatus Lachnoclostridium avicola]
MLIIKGADVYAPEHLGMMDVMVCGGKIEKMAGDIPVCYEDCQVIDGRGKILAPGIIDQHVHLTGGGGEGSFHTRAPEASFSELIRGGVTTVVGLLGTDGITRSVENLLAKVKALREEGITAFCLTGSYGWPSVTVTGDVKKDIVFISEVLGLKLAVSDHRAPNISVDELIRVASDVRVAGMLSGKPGIITLHMGDDPRGLEPVFQALERTSIPIKTFRPTHVARNWDLFDQALKFGKMNGYIDITCDSGREKKVAEALRRAQKAGVDLGRITISSDGQGSWSDYDEEGNLVKIGVSSVSAVFRQIMDLVRCGELNLEQAFSIATANPAKALELSAKGRICPGADGDLLLIRRDNLALDMVLAMGRVMMEHGEPVVRGTFE